MKEIHEKWQDPTEETADMKRLRYEIVLTCRMYQETYGLGDDCLVACLKNATDQIGCSATENELRNDVSMRLSLIENGLKEAVKQIDSIRTDLQSKNGFYENYKSFPKKKLVLSDPQPAFQRRKTKTLLTKYCASILNPVQSILSP